AGQPWIDPRVLPHVRALADPETGLARPGAVAAGRPWQEPDGGWASVGRVDLHESVDTTGRTADRRGDFDMVYGDWSAVAERLGGAAAAPAAPSVGEPTSPQRLDAAVRAALRHAEADPAGISDADALALFGADGAGLDALCRLAD